MTSIRDRHLHCISQLFKRRCRLVRIVPTNAIAFDTSLKKYFCSQCFTFESMNNDARPLHKYHAHTQYPADVKLFFYLAQPECQPSSPPVVLSFLFCFCCSVRCENKPHRNVVVVFVVAYLLCVRHESYEFLFLSEINFVAMHLSFSNVLCLSSSPTSPLPFRNGFLDFSRSDPPNSRKN